MLYGTFRSRSFDRPHQTEADFLPSLHGVVEVEIAKILSDVISNFFGMSFFIQVSDIIINVSGE